MYVLIISTLIVIITSFFCSLTEAILLSLNPLTINKLKKRQPHAAEAWTRMKRNIGRPIAAILILNTIANSGGATVAGGAFTEIFNHRSLWIFSTLFTLTILLGTEILPKIIGVTFRDRLAPLVARPLESVTAILRPLVYLIETMFHRLSRDRESEQITTADIITLASMARLGRVIGLEQENIIINAIRLNHTTVEHVMIPSEKVDYLKSNDNIETILNEALKSGRTRYPISSSDKTADIDHFINIKGVLPMIKGEAVQPDFQHRPLLNVFAYDTLLRALRTMLEHRQHMLSVLGKNQKCVGIITLEDITAELLGADIEDFK
jgi:CBS domain containing-hemolysin-like protein